MKIRIKHIVLASAVLVSVSSFAQKDELKALKKIYDKETPSDKDLAEYKALLLKAEPLINPAIEADKINFEFLKATSFFMEFMIAASKPENATNDMIMEKIFTGKNIVQLVLSMNNVLDFEKKSGKQVYTKDIEGGISGMKPFLVDYAIALGKSNKNKEAGEVLYAVYTLDKKDLEMLFYAASYEVNVPDYDKALEYYTELKNINYSGEGTLYYAVNNITKQEENFGTNKKMRDLGVSSTTHSKPRDEKIPSKRGEIYKNIALILKEKGKTNEAIVALADARKVNPDDESLTLAQAEMYLANKDFDTYTQLVNEVLAKNPNNVDLVYNLGVISSNANKLDEAEKYYARALVLDPSYFNALLAISELKLRSDEKLVTEMNKLGTSEKDNKRYEVIKAERDKNFKSILPYLEKAVEVRPDDEAAKKTLLSVYNALEMTDKYKALKAKQ